MSKAKTANKPAAKKPFAKKPAAKKPAAKKPAAKKPVGVIDVAGLDGSRDDVPVDVSPGVLAAHAEVLASTVLAKRRALERAKVTVDDAARLLALAALLRKRETAWRNLWKTAGTGALAAAREPARAGRDQLFSALRVFANGRAATQAALDDIAGVENDTDLLEDLDRLLALAGEHRADLAGTDTDEAFVASAAKAREAFRVARQEVRAATGAASLVELSDEALAARRARNRVFWSLADLDRTVCQRGSHAFRSDPRGLRLFAAYTHRAKAAVKAAPAAPGPTG